MKFERWTSREPETEPIYTSMTGGWSTLRLHFDDGGCQTCGLHFDDGEGTSSSNHRYANSQEGRRFCVTHRCRGVSHRMYFGVGSSYRIVITPNSGEVFDTEGE